MKSYLIAWLAVLAVAILPSHGYITEDVINWYKDMADEIPDGIEDEGPRKIEETVVGAPILQMAEAASEPNASVSCNCGDECAKLHISRLPPEVQKVDNYLSYENFPVLCRDASAIMLPPGGRPMKKYVCKQTFDCCRHCNADFYVCIRNVMNTYGACMRGAYKCMCDCIDRKSFAELPYKPTPSP